MFAHTVDALTVAPDEVVRVADLWLRSTPGTWPRRAEAAALAVAAGHRVIDASEPGTYGVEEHEARVWRALLAAVDERRDDVVEMTSMLSGRHTNSDTAEDDNELEEDDDLGLGPPGPRRQRMDHAFRKTCLESDALHPVIAADPRLAGDILFAILAPQPRRRSRFGMPLPGDELGMDHMPGWLFPLYARGPFLAFIRGAPAEARAFALRLVDATTDSWGDARDEDGELVGEIDVPLADSRTLRLRGDEHVFQWYRGDSRVPGTVASMLMALEKWLYDEADAGNDIGPVIRELLEGTTSAAIAGVLVAVGCRHPDLFKSSLRPLLSAPEFYIWDTRYKMFDQGHLLMGLFGAPPALRRMAEEWYGLEHRRTQLEHVAQRLMLTDEGVAAQLEQARPQWLGRVDDRGEPSVLRFLAARMDPANWVERTHERGFTYWEFEAPRELREEGELAAEETNQHGFWLMMPMQCRQILAGEIELQEANLEEFWNGVQSRLSLTPPEDVTNEGVISGEDAQCGVAAVLVIQYRQWLHEHPERELWCLDKMLEAVTAPRQRQWFDAPQGGTAWSWDAFCADALPILWAESPEEPLLRQAIARLALHIHYATIARLFAATATLRATLGDDFGRLQHLAIHIARFRVAVEVAHDDAEERERAFATLRTYLDRFIDGTLDPNVPAWAQLAVPSDRPARRRWTELDTSFLQAAYAWMPLFAEARNPQERSAWITHWQESVKTLVERLEQNIDPRDGEVDGTPYESEYELLRALPARIIDMEPDEARMMWEPILALGEVAHYWVDSFLDAWFMTGLQMSDPSDAFVREWESMLDYAEQSEAWTSAGGARRHRTALQRALMGLGGYGLDLWSGQHTATVERMTPRYERWAQASLQRREDAVRFCQFLHRPAAETLLADGLRWLAAADTPTAQWDRDDGYERAAGELLDHIARDQRDLPRSDTPAGDSYRLLLKRLVDRQVPVALELQSRMASSESP